jgi:hypothetical protein
MGLEQRGLSFTRPHPYPYVALFHMRLDGDIIADLSGDRMSHGGIKLVLDVPHLSIHPSDVLEVSSFAVSHRVQEVWSLNEAVQDESFRTFPLLLRHDDDCGGLRLLPRTGDQGYS